MAGNLSITSRHFLKPSSYRRFALVTSASWNAFLARNIVATSIERVGSLLEIGAILPIVKVGIVLVVNRELQRPGFELDIAGQLLGLIRLRRLLVRNPLRHVAIGNGNFLLELRALLVLIRRKLFAR